MWKKGRTDMTSPSCIYVLPRVPRMSQKNLATGKNKVIRSILQTDLDLLYSKYSSDSKVISYVLVDRISNHGRGKGFSFLHRT
jgi:hypothetical protein